MKTNKSQRPFKTYRQQLKILRNRNLKIDDGNKAINYLKKYGYYNIINGYKEIFLMPHTNIETYFDGTHFENIISLYKFDKKIRHIFMYYLLDFETLIKNKISYYHSELNDNKFNYLDVNNFEGDIKDITSLILNITNSINTNTSKKSNAISHYMDKYKELPLWVLFRHLTFGNISYFYKLLLTDIKNKICKELEKEFYDNYKQKITISNQFLEYTINFTNIYRNVCAHEERMYFIRYNKKINNSKNYIDYGKYNKEFNGSIFDLTILLKLFISKKEFKILISKLKRSLSILEKELQNNPNAFKKIKRKLDFPDNWEEKLNKFWL